VTAAERRVHTEPRWADTTPTWPTRASAARVIKHIPDHVYAHYAVSRPTVRTVAGPGHASAADAAQARRFDDILQAELAELQSVAAGLQRRSADQQERRHTKELHQVNAGIKEVLRLLDGLEDRFGPL
jgi:hypothetical protein